MSSLKMTFSLTSLIFLIAFGLVFTPTSVWAHSDAQRDSDSDGTADIGVHTHPVLQAINADPSADPPVLAVPVHNEHPTVESIVLKEGDTVDGNMVEVDATTNTTFTVVVTFDQAVVNAANLANTTTIADTDLADSELTFALLNVDNTLATAATVAITRATDDTDTADIKENETTFEIVVTPGAYPTGTANANDKTLRFRIQVNADSVYSLQTSELIPGNVAPVTVAGGGVSAPDVAVFTLVDELPEAADPPDTTSPTVTITPPTAAATNGDLVFDFEFSEELGNASNDLQAGDIDVTGGTIASVVQDTKDAKKYAVTVTPTDTPPQVAISLRADSVADTAGNFIDLTGTNDGKSTYDEVHPTVVSHTHAVLTETPTGHTGDFLDFTFTFSEPIDKSTITVSAVDQGSSHNAHFNVSYFFDAADTAGDATNSYTITVKVLDPQKVTTIALKIGDRIQWRIWQKTVLLSLTLRRLHRSLTISKRRVGAKNKIGVTSDYRRRQILKGKV